MAWKKNKNQVIVRISVENGIPRVRQLTGEEEREFYKKHPNASLPTFSPEDIERGLEAIGQQFGTTHPKSQSPESLIPDPSTISILNDHSAK